MKLDHCTWPEVEEYLERSQLIIVPVGSTEQHGPTGLIGTDYLAAQMIAQEVGKRTQCLVAPPICFGMSSHHMGFPGTISLQPLTYVAVVLDVISSLYHHGFKKIFFINGHGGNTPSLQVAFQQFKNKENDIVFEMIDWWKMDAVKQYEEKHFGQSSGSHATIGEIAVIQYLLHEDACRPALHLAPAPRFQHPWPLSAQVFRKTFPDGRMYSDPCQATPEHGANIFELAVQALCSKIN